jgi:type IV secretory pathway VirB2 component (pilin)
MNLKKFIKDSRHAIAANHAAKEKENRQAVAVMGFMLIAALSVAPTMAMAAPWDSAATAVLGIFTNGLTRTIAIIAVIAMGIAAMAGKLSWEWAIKIIVGIVLVFGAAAIVDYVIAASA